MSSAAAPRLKPVLGLWDLVFYGIVAVTPSAPATIFGLAEQRSQGHAIVTILAAMVAMVLTAVSYGRMAAVYPLAGSAYTYVGKGLHPHAGFAAGWAMLLDYVVCPLFCVSYGTLVLQRLVPELPFAVGSALLAGGITILNVRGIRSTARANQVLLALMMAVLAAYILLAIRYVLSHAGVGGLLSIKPFYNPATFHLRAIAGATSIAALTYLGFDAVTTLAEDARDPRRNVLLAAVLVCLFTGLFGGLLVYLSQCAWPAYQTYSHIETAFIDVAQRVGGSGLFHGMTAMLLVSMIGAGLTIQVGAARVLFGMGRDNVLPRDFFSYLHPARNTPTRNIWLLGALAYGGSQVLSYELTAELLNFGAFLGFMGVNLAVISHFWVRGKTRRMLADLVLPGLGFLFCGAIWWGLAVPAKIAGAVWFAVGLTILTARTRFFRRRWVMNDPASYEGGTL